MFSCVDGRGIRDRMGDFFVSGCGLSGQSNDGELGWERTYFVAFWSEDFCVVYQYFCWGELETKAPGIWVRFLTMTVGMLADVLDLNEQAGL